MNDQLTPAQPPIAVRIADDIRLRIERQELEPGDPVPTLRHLAETWSCSIGSARSAVDLLKQQGLVSTKRGRAPFVRLQLRRIVRDSARHQVEKDLVVAPEQVRAATGAAETDMDTELNKFDFQAIYETITVDTELTHLFATGHESEFLRRTYELKDQRTGLRHAWSVSHVPLPLIADHPSLLDSSNEPWPGGTQHQLHMVGIEITHVDDLVWAQMPSTVDTQHWGLTAGVPLLLVRRISYDTSDRVVEVSDATYPADRTELRFRTPLTPFPDAS